MCTHTHCQNRMSLCARVCVCIIKRKCCTNLCADSSTVSLWAHSGQMHKMNIKLKLLPSDDIEFTGKGATSGARLSLCLCACVYKIFSLFIFFLYFWQVSLCSARIKRRAPPASSAWPNLLHAASVAVCNPTNSLTNCVIGSASLTKLRNKETGLGCQCTLCTHVCSC